MPKNPASTARKLPVIERSAFYTSPATGRTYWIDANGLATEEQEPEYGCECEQDWNCGLHGGTNSPTWIETRHTDYDEEGF